jgi:hypothetical protein
VLAQPGVLVQVLDVRGFSDRPRRGSTEDGA